MIRQTFAIIIFAELRTEFRLRGNDRIQVAQIPISTGAQIVSDWFRFGHFGPNKPERLDERQVHRVLPLLAEVPETKRAGVLIAESNRLIANEKFREPRCNRPLDEPGPLDKFRREPGIGEEAAQ